MAFLLHPMPAAATSLLVFAATFLATPAASPAVAQAAAQVAVPSGRPITLAEALAAGLDKGRTLRIRKAELDRALAARSQAEAGLWPTLGVSSRVETGRSSQGALQVQLDRDKDLVVAPGFTNFDSQSTTITGSLTLGYDFDLAGDRAGRIAVAREQAGIADLERRRAALQLRYDVTIAYLDLQEAQEEVRIAQLILDSARTTRGDTEKLSRGGEATVFDDQRATLQVILAEQAHVEARRRSAAACRSLAKLLTLPSAEPLVAADPVKPAGDWALGVQESVDRALASRPELAQQAAGKRIAEQQARIARATVWPRPQVFLAGDTAAFPQPGGGAPQAIGRLGPGFGFSAGAALQWPLFDGFAARASEKQAEHDAAAAQLRLEEAQADIRAEIEQGVADLDAFRQMLGTTDRAVALSRQGLESARKRFHAGFGTQTDVILAIENLNKAESQRVKAILGLNRNLALLERAAGDGRQGM